MSVTASLSQLMEQLDVFISIKPKPKQPSKVGSIALLVYFRGTEQQ